MKTDVIIIGAGPTGLMAANQLMRFGIDFIILDTKSGPTIQSRAIAVTARSMEIYQQMGLAQKVVDGGAKINSFNVYSDGKKKGEVKIGEIGIGLTDFHYLLGFEQSKNEEMLYENLVQHDKNVLWNTEFLHLHQELNKVTATVKSNDKEFEIEGKYLIACDGARSPIRHQLHFKFDGGTYENKFFVADVVMNWELEYDKLVITPGDQNLCGFFPLKGDRYYRVLGTLPKEYFTKEDIVFEDLKKVIIETWGLPMTFEKVNWFSVYKLHHRCVNRFQSGNVFLAGDAAHIHSPAGGQGMNTGLQDAYNLVWKLAFVLKGYANKDLLLTYNEERLPFAQWLMNFTDRAFNMMTSDNWFIRNFRKHIGLNMIGYVFQNKNIRPRLFKTVSQTWYSYNGKSLTGRMKSKQNLKFKAGDRLPFIKEHFYELFREPGFHLLIISNTKEKTVDTSLFPFPVKIVHSEISDWNLQGVNSDLYILLRPDNYIACVMDEWNAEKIKIYTERVF